MEKYLLILGILGCHSVAIQTLLCPGKCHCSSTLIQCSYTAIKIWEIEKTLCSNSESITELYLMGNKLNDSSIKSLKCFRNLKVLQLSYNSLTRFPTELLKSLTSLTTLYLTTNNIVRLPTSLPNSTLEILYLDNNRISDLPNDLFKDARSIKELYLNKNKIKKLKENIFKGLTRLEKIYLNNNEIEEIDEGIFKTCPHLTEVYLQSNKLVEIANIFQTNTKLKKIFLHENSLRHLSPNVFKRLELEKLYLYSNNFTVLQDLFSDTISIKEFYTHDNPFQCSCQLIKFRNLYEKKFLTNNARVTWGRCTNALLTENNIKIKELSKNHLNCSACSIATCEDINTTCVESNSTKSYVCRNLTTSNIALTTLKPRQSTGAITSAQKSNEPFNDVIIIVSVVVAIGLLVFAGIAVCAIYRTKKQKFSLDEEGESVVASTADLSVSGSIKLESLKRKEPSQRNGNGVVRFNLEETYLMIPEVDT